MEVPLPTQMSPEYNLAYLEGQAAFANGLGCDENPYQESNAELSIQGWTDGWCDASEEARQYNA